MSWVCACDKVDVVLATGMTLYCTQVTSKHKQRCCAVHKKLKPRNNQRKLSPALSLSLSRIKSITAPAHFLMCEAQNLSFELLLFCLLCPS